jgi:ADP-ribose pyrophosphatase YjhB (NUDIX family)
MEEDENPRSCAIREVEEECGIHGLTITKELASTYHTFTQDGRRILKRTYWFVMEYRGNESPKPQKEEHITAAVWMNRTKVTKALSNTYNSIKDVIYSLENS